MDFKEMVQRAVNVEAKAGLRSSTMVRDPDICCPKNHRPFISITSKMKTQKTTGKKPKPEESRPKKPKLAEGKNPTPPCSKSTEFGKTFCTNKKREYFKKKRDWKNNTSVTGDNANAVEIGEKKQNNWGDKKCYNYQKKGYFSKNCPEHPKN